MTKKIFSWIKSNKQEFFFLTLIIFLAAFFRLWKIDEYLPFLGDEGRDVRVVRKLLLFGDLMFIGPRTSIGDMYLGPLYYYWISPWLALFQFSPVGPAISVAFLGVATVALMWFMANEWFGKIAGFISSFLYAISPLVINQTKHSWNPNIMPFFALLSIYSIWKVWSQNSYKWLLVLAVSFAFVLQSHYLGLLLLPTLGLGWITVAISKKQEGRRFFVFSLVAFSLFALLMSPLFLFDSKHEWHNIQAMTKFFTERQTTVSAKPWNALPGIWPLWTDKFITRIMSANIKTWGAITATILTLGWAVSFIKNKNKLSNPTTFVGLWLLTGLIGLALLKQEVYDHYFGFMFPAPFFIAGMITEELWKTKLKPVLLILLIGLVYLNLQNNPLKYPPQKQMQRVQQVSQEIVEKSDGKPFNFALIAKRNYEEGYLYFFELAGTPVRIVDPQHSETKTDQLFVVCEDPICDNPIYSPKAEIAHFGMSKVDREWEIRGLKLYKLVHNQ